jgi:Reverse transcriptase (RNA-dependent DNA polymerase)
LNSEILSFGFKRNIDDPCLYHRWNKINIKNNNNEEMKECLTLVAVYVDNIIVASDAKIFLQETVDGFKEKMSMTIMGDISFLLGMEIKRKENCIFLTQTLYINRLAETSQ